MDRGAQRNQPLKTLVFNPGSNSLKWARIETGATDPHLVRGIKLQHGAIDDVLDQGKAALSVLEQAGEFDCVACRVVHGGGRFTSPLTVDEAVIRAIESFEDIAPLHNKSSVAIFRALRDKLANAVEILAVFDTDFHQTIPEVAWRYGIGYELANELRIRRFGFHGISHKYLTLRYAEITATPLDRTHIITLHLEGGSSATAVRGGQSIDTSMGFTPLEGLMMGTRCGDIDASLVGYLMKKKHVDVDEVNRWLTKESGLNAISGISQDTRVLVKHLEDPRACLALQMFSYRVRKYIGAYLAALGDGSALVFGGGIGENTPLVRQQICEGLESLGIDFDAARNTSVIDREGKITREGSRIEAWVIPTQEDLLIAHEAACFFESAKIR